VDDGTGWKDVPPPAPHSVVQLKPETIQAIRDGLWMVVNGRGTGAKARIAGRDVSGKTGTAQVISLEGGKAAKGRSEKDLRDNGWFVFFAPRDNPQIAGVVFVEHGGHGGTTAAPIAKHVLETFFAKQDGQPLPVLKGLSTTPVDGDEPIAPPVTVTAPLRAAGAGGAR
jgi:penicillin-binding protein 2